MIELRRVEDLSSLERLALMDISYSRLDTYATCPAKYYYSYILLQPQTFSAPATLGNIVHAVMEETVGEEDGHDLVEMSKYFEQYRDQKDPDGQISNELIDAGYTMMGEFVDRHSPEEFVTVLAKEQAFEFVLGNALVRGYIDRVDRTPRGIRVVDYKSGKYEIAAKEIATNLQLGVYALACSLLYPEAEQFDTELYYLRSGRRKGHPFQRAELPEVADRVHAQIVTLTNDVAFHETSVQWPCISFCDHATSGVCKTGAVRRAKRAKRVEGPYS